MSTDALEATTLDSVRPTRVRHLILGVTTLMSVLLYLDRFAVSIAMEYIREDLRMSQTQMAWFISLFFWSYALFQVPAGWLSDRFGARMMLTAYILAWSIFTGLLGVAHTVWLLLTLRLLCGITQAGAYPTAASIARHWYPITFRGTANSIIGLGGRFGAVLAPVLTALLIVHFVSGKTPVSLSSSDILDRNSFLAHFDPDRDVSTAKTAVRHRQQFVTSFFSNLPEPQREAISSAARSAGTVISEQKKKTSTSQSPSIIEIQGIEWGEFLTLIANQMADANFVEANQIPENISASGRALLERRSTGNQLSNDETAQLNRFLLEALFSAEVRKSIGPGWRPTMMVYGIAGILVAAIFVLVARNTPQQHPWCNAAEQSLIQHGTSASSTASNVPAPRFPWAFFLTSISLWGNSMTQFLTNVGWFFVVSYLPRYLSEVHGVSLVMQGVMTAFPSATGIAGAFLGGLCTDWAVQRIGLKWGRRVPLVISRLTAAAGYGLCLVLSMLFVPGSDKPWLPWLYIVGLCIAATSTDFGSPAIWAYAQDVGGKFTASVLGWANMMGNIGAAVAPLIYIRCLGDAPTVESWNLVFAVAGGAFILSALSGMLLDSTKPLTIPDPEPVA